MPEDESRPASSEIREPLAQIPLRAPWQPITFRGVAAFSRARIGRVLTLQVLVAAVLAITLIWFLIRAWFPPILQAIRALPNSGELNHRQLDSPRATAEPLAANNFLALAINLDRAASLSSTSDVRVEFQRTSLAICSLLGCASILYPDGRVAFSQQELEAWWGAWRVLLLVIVALLTAAWLFLTWYVLASCYAFPVWFLAYLHDRQLSFLGSWKMCLTCLLTPALLMAGAIWLYGINAIDLLHLLLIWCAHLPLGWVYLYFSVRALPRVQQAPASTLNPFVGDRPIKSPNPFGTSKDGS